jgi:N-acetylglutamate synthase-like GNAT family acetyltransferase
MEYIRKATPADAERIRFIAEQCWWLSSGNIEAQIKIEQMVHDLYSHGKLTYEITNNISVFLLAIDEELAVAFTSYTFKGNDVLVSELNALYCLPETQGKRLDELLVNEVIKNTLAEGGNKVFVVLTNYNGPVSLFERLGFKPLKINDPKASGSEILIMSKNL